RDGLLTLLIPVSIIGSILTGLAMPYRVTRFESTPNPNALKCLVEPSPGPVPRSYRAADEAAGDDVAEALFEIPGVTSMLIHEEFITVVKSPAARWKPIRDAVKSTLKDAPSPASS
ncbi:MAG: NifU N-terminal domain-containing protein, partial [Planctomycetota bacterium]